MLTKIYWNSFVFTLLIFVSGCVGQELGETEGRANFNRSVSVETKALEKRVAAGVNARRRAAGLQELSYHAGLSDLARRHSEYLIGVFERGGKRVINHKGGGKRSRIMMGDYRMYETGENVAYVWGYKDDLALRFTRNWMNSPLHKKNILRHWSHTGVGVARGSDNTVYATQLFGFDGGM